MTIQMFWNRPPNMVQIIEFPELKWYFRTSGSAPGKNLRMITSSPSRMTSCTALVDREDAASSWTKSDLTLESMILVWTVLLTDRGRGGQNYRGVIIVSIYRQSDLCAGQMLEESSTNVVFFYTCSYPQGWIILASLGRLYRKLIVHVCSCW